VEFDLQSTILIHGVVRDQAQGPLNLCFMNFILQTNQMEAAGATEESHDHQQGQTAPEGRDQSRPQSGGQCCDVARHSVLWAAYVRTWPGGSAG
jgi:hypothetical protein